MEPQDLLLARRPRLRGEDRASGIAYWNEKRREAQQQDDRTGESCSHVPTRTAARLLAAATWSSGDRKVLFAILILVVTHFVAKAVQWGVAKLVDRMPVLKRHPGVGGDSVGTELGRLAYWLVWLVGLIAALQPARPVGRADPCHDADQ